MKTLPISKLILNNSQIKQGIFSKYAQRFLKADTRGFLFNFSKFFDIISPDNLAKNEKVLKDIGIKQIGKNIEEGLLIGGKEFDYHICIPQTDTIHLNLLDKKNNVSQSIKFNQNSESYEYSGNIPVSEIEDFLTDILANIDSKISKASRQLTSDIPKPLIPDDKTSQKLEELNKTLAAPKKKSVITNFGLASKEEQDLIQAIKDEYYYIKELFREVPNDASRFNVRNRYENYVTDKSAKNIMHFNNIGPMGEPISISEVSHKNKIYFVMSVTDVMGKEQKFVFSDEGKIQKNLPFISEVRQNKTLRRNAIPNYYTQQEINDSKLLIYLNCLNRELKLFSQHTENWLQKQDEIKEIHSNKDIASTESFNEIIKDIFDQFQQYRTKIIKLIPSKEKRDRFKTANGISTEKSTSSITFLNLSPNKNNLRLSFPTIPNNTATQILEMRGDKVEKSFYIIDNKLLRINLRTKYDRFLHYKRKMYFYDNEYVKKSNLNTYLETIQKKLHEINENLNTLETYAAK